MSGSVPIPPRRFKARFHPTRASSSSSLSSPSGSSFSASPNTAGSSSQEPLLAPEMLASTSSSSSSSSSSSPSSSSLKRSTHYRQPSLLGPSISKQEHTVVNVGNRDGAPRLISCVKTSQGFDWNQDIFLPSYAGRHSSDLERRPDPVHDIVLTDAEARGLFPE